MNPVWRAFLGSCGAVIDAGAVVRFADADEELRESQSGSVVADLSYLGVLEFSGDDAESFLQGQLSCDVRGVVPGSGTVGGYCTPKGRLLADFLLFRASASVFRMLLAGDITDAIRRRLAMYVLRADVKISDRGDHLVRIGAAGPGAGDAIGALFAIPDSAGAGSHGNPAPGDLVRLPGDRFVIVAEPAVAEIAWRALSQRLLPVGSPCWEWIDVRAGFPWITAATQDRFLPQMIGLDHLGGVSFRKGCYPGQEIVARTQYLGTPKRHLFPASVAAPCPAPGTPLFGQGPSDQSVGTVVSAARSPDGRCELLAVVHESAGLGVPLHVQAPGGPLLSFADRSTP